MKLSVILLAKMTQSEVSRFQTFRQSIYLSHVKWVTGKVQLEKYFNRFGPVKRVDLFFDRESGLHRGFASVTFADNESAAKAVQSGPHIIDGQPIHVEFSVPFNPKKATAARRDSSDCS